MLVKTYTSLTGPMYVTEPDAMLFAKAGRAHLNQIINAHNSVVTYLKFSKKLSGVSDLYIGSPFSIEEIKFKVGVVTEYIDKNSKELTSSEVVNQISEKVSDSGDGMKFDEYYIYSDAKNQVKSAIGFDIALPGYSKSDITSELVEDKVEIKAKDSRKHPASFLTSKIRKGDQVIKISVPNNCDRHKINIKFVNGILSIVFPFKKVAKPKGTPIEIK